MKIYAGEQPEQAFSYSEFTYDISAFSVSLASGGKAIIPGTAAGKRQFEKTLLETLFNDITPSHPVFFAVAVGKVNNKAQAATKEGSITTRSTINLALFANFDPREALPEKDWDAYDKAKKEYNSKDSLILSLSKSIGKLHAKIQELENAIAQEKDEEKLLELNERISTFEDEILEHQERSGELRTEANKFWEDEIEPLREEMLRFSEEVRYSYKDLTFDGDTVKRHNLTHFGEWLVKALRVNLADALYLDIYTRFYGRGGFSNAF